MKKAIVIGCPGAGKSTFARRLRDASGLPLHYLDMIWHRPDKTNISREEFDARLLDICAGDAWIIDGNYRRTIEARLQHCDTVFLFDLPTGECLAGAQARIGTVREDMPWVEEEFDPEFRAWIEDFHRDQLPEIYELLEKYKDNLNIIVFKSRKDADEFIEEALR